MAGEAGRSSVDLKTDLKEDLFTKTRAYSFFQAIRLLRLFQRDLTGEETAEALFHEVLRIRPLLSLSFPGTDLYSVEKKQFNNQVHYLLTATFLGLYGASSPLPTHYTEDLLEEASDDRSVTRDFLDIFSDPFYRLFFQSWSKYRWFLKIGEEDDQSYLERLFCLVGLGLGEFRDKMPNARELLRYIGLFSQFPRSAMGLETLLTDAMGCGPVRVTSAAVHPAPIPEDQRCCLGAEEGAILGDDCYLGVEIEDRTGKIIVTAGPMGEEAYHSFLPGSPSNERIKSLINFFLIQPLTVDLELIIKKEETAHLTLGDEKWSSLGGDAWVYSGPVLEKSPTVVFNLLS
ncbi:MAG: type VI secretion system baseplate subunit TssG [Pseudomonadota bacterium]